VKRDGLALAFAMIFPSIMAWLYFVVLAGGQPPSQVSLPNVNRAVIFAYGLGKVIQFLFPAFFVWLTEPGRLRPAKPTFRGMALGASFGLLVVAGIFLLYYTGLRAELVQIKAPEQIAAKLRQFGLFSPAGFLVLAVFISVVHSLLEEYYWRWFVFGQLRKWLPVAGAVVLSSLAFMAHHVIILAVYLRGPEAFFTRVVPFSLGIAVGGGVWAWLYHKSGSIYAPWVSHLIIDAGIMAVGYDLLFR
jgi:membrane protease YdiL (CAAX protease family)